MRYRLAIVAVLGLVSACDAFSPTELGAVRFTPPPSYRAAWLEAQSCTGRHRDFDQIEWWVVPNVTSFDDDNEGWVMGSYNDRHGRITIAGDYLSHPMVVRHEMIHALGFQRSHPHNQIFSHCKAMWGTWDQTEQWLELPRDLARYGLRP